MSFGTLSRWIFLISLFAFAHCWNVPSSNGIGSNSSNFNSVPAKENVDITSANENLIFPKDRTKKRLFALNSARAGEGNDGEISAQTDRSAGKEIRFGKMKLEIAKLISKNPSNETSAAVSSPISERKSENEIPEMTAGFSESGMAIKLGNQSTPVVGIRSETIESVGNITIQPGGRIRTPVKLNMKQGLLMNQILSTYGLGDVNDSLCKGQVDEFKLGLRALEPWAIKMFDASSKLMSGILGGNIAEFGAFKQCLDIHEITARGAIRGKHCTLHIHPTDELLRIVLSYRRKFSEKHFQNLKQNVLDGVKLSWSVCVPNSCSHEDVLRHFSKSFAEVTEGLNLSLTLAEKHCVTLDNVPSMTNGDYVYISCVCLVITAVIGSTILDTIKDDDSNEIVGLFSLKRNARTLFSSRESSNDISCLHGLRFLSMYLIVYGHRYIHNMATPVVNYMDLVDWLETYFSTTVHGGTTTVDTFFLVSATLLSYMFFSMLSKGIRINLFLFYLNRHLRLLVPLALTAGTYATVLKHFGGGPLYRDFYMNFSAGCQYFWWSTLLYLQAFVNPRAICIVQAWYLSADMFWYYLSPLMLFTLARSTTIGYIIMLGFYIVTTGSNFYVAWIHRFNGQMPVTPGLLTSDYFCLHYVQPLVRGGPYVLGLAFGHALFQTKDRKVAMSSFAKKAGWFSVSLCLPTVVLITRSFRLEDFEYNRTFASLFLACHRSVWTFGVMWIIWCCQNGHGGMVNTILSWGGFKILGRLCYNIFLFHYVFQAAMQNSKKVPSYFSDFICIYDSLSDTVLMILLSIPLTLCFEYPFVRLCGLLLKTRNKDNITKIKPVNMKVTLGTKP